LERALAENERLRQQLEEALRVNKRSAAPFSKGEPKKNPKPPGRKPGAAYDSRATKPVPSRVGEQIHVPLPRCTHTAAAGSSGRIPKLNSRRISDG